MKKRLSFVLLIATLHFLFAAAAGCETNLVGNGTRIAGPLANLLFSPLFYPLRGILPAGLIMPALIANSLLWGVMAERLVWGRKKVMTRRRSKSL